MEVIFIQGPTASGKSALALETAQKLDCDIISCDSIQVYKYVNIGSAKPTQEEMALVKHHLIDFVEPPNEYTAGEFRKDALRILKEQEDMGKSHSLVVGGTGFYFQALENGMHSQPPTPQKIVDLVANEFKEKGRFELYQELRSKDPGYARKISENDTYRLLKAIESIRAYNKTPTEIRSEFRPMQFPYPLKKKILLPDRDKLRKNIRLRFQKMWAMNFLEEVVAFKKQGLENWTPLQSVGYKEVLDFIDGNIKSYQELEELVVQKTMQLAKRQSTWFRNTNK